MPWDQLKWKTLNDIQHSINSDIKRLKPYLKKEIQKEMEEEKKKKEEEKAQQEL